jgi:iron-sulfur cluster repair protein YtfE (RIC family)
VTSTPPFAPRTRTAQEPEPDLTSIVVIHRAIRHDLRRLAACLAEIPDRGAPSSQAHAIRRYAAALFAEICQHLDNEDGILWPVIAATAGQAVDLTPLTDDHQAIEAAFGRAFQALASFRTNPEPPGDLHASVTELRDMLDDHITDEEQQILPAMRRYLPAEAYRSCEKQIQRKTPLAGIWFTAPWLARHAHPDELSRPLAACGWPGRILLAAARPGYARLERQAFCIRPADDTRHLPARSSRDMMACRSARFVVRRSRECAERAGLSRGHLGAWIGGHVRCLRG